MEQIKPGKYVEMIYDLYVKDNDGEQLVHQVDPENPERIVFGVTRGVIAPLEKALDGLAAGEEFDVYVAAAEAFGMPDPEQIAQLDKSVFEIDGKFDAEHIKTGADIPMMTADGFRLNGKVLAVTDDKVEMDFNHPLAGKDVRFKGKVVTVRDATPEELQPAHGCGCGCDHDHCGDGACGDHECGDGCGCH
ncbi:MAG: FKBP-type peptidyl-prolyl cis-trans isomerase [Muribaculum sp.]|nr:FKBP-type peptidyl-prolyl cis-trans isomerase [Muribaculum sp.]